MTDGCDAQVEDLIRRFASAAEELVAALDAGIDAFFTDFPASGAAVRNRLRPAG